MRLATVDLDSAEGLEQLWAELKRHRAIREADPPLRAAILRRADRLPAEIAQAILKDLDELHPAVVCEAHFRTLVPNIPTIGAIGRSDA